MNWSPRFPRFGLVHELTLLGLCVIAALVFILLCVSAVPAGWGSGSGGSCSSGQCAVSRPITPQPTLNTVFSWKAFPDDSDQVALLLNGVQVGGYRFSSGTYRSLTNGEWSAFRAPPVAPPQPQGGLPARRTAAPTKPASLPCGKPSCDCGCPNGTCRCATAQAPAPELPAWMTEGVTKENIAHREKVTICGREITKDAALEAITAPGTSLPEDAGKPFLVMVGDAGTLAKVKADAAPLTGFRQQYYTPDAPMIRDRDGKVLYQPGLYFTRADGTALSYTAAYPGPEKLQAAGAEALRRADPNFDPAKVPDLSKPPPPPTKPAPEPPPGPATPEQPAANYLPHAGCACGALFVALMLLRKKSSE